MDGVKEAGPSGAPARHKKRKHKKSRDGGKGGHGKRHKQRKASSSRSRRISKELAEISMDPPSNCSGTFLFDALPYRASPLLSLHRALQLHAAPRAFSFPSPVPRLP